MEVTFLGHQSWCVESDSHKLLIDPLYKCMGNGNTKLPVWPNRKLNLEEMHKVDAVLISHEHADHFDIETLLRIRKILRPQKVYVPDLSTSALKNALKKMGFFVEELHSFERIFLGDLEILPLPSLKSRLEPDVYSLLVSEKKTGASFYTPIDAMPSQFTLAYLDEYCPQRTLDNFTNNFVQRIPSLHNLSENALVSGMNQAYDFLRRFIADFKPRTVLISGGGWSYPDPIGIHNRVMFTVPHEDLVAHARIQYPFLKFDAAQVGQTYVLVGADCSVAKTSKPYILPLQNDERRFDNVEFCRNRLILPYCRRLREYPEMESVVTKYVETSLGVLISLGAAKLGRALHSLKTIPEDGLNGFYFELREKDRSWQYEFHINDSKFSLISEKLTYQQAKERYAFGLIGFMYDFYQILMAREEAHLVAENAMYVWNNRKDILNESADIDFMQCFRPQYRSHEFENFYRQEIESYASKL